MNDCPAVYEKTERTARKAHRCCECNVAIKPGDRYVEHTGLWCGSWDRFRQCRWCAEWFEAAAQDAEPYSEEGPSFGGLLEYLSETYAHHTWTGRKWICTFWEGIGRAKKGTP